MRASNGFKFQITGSEEETYVIYSSTSFTTWTPIATNKMQNGNWAFTDTNAVSATNASLRFYKVQLIS